MVEVMRLFVKIFFLATVLISIALGMSGYMMITSSFENAITREVQIVTEQYQSDKYRYQVLLLRNDGIIPNTADGAVIINGFGINSNLFVTYGTNYASVINIELNRLSAIYDEEQKLIYSNSLKTDLSLSEDFENNTILQTFRKINGKYYIVIESDFNLSDSKYYFISAVNINRIMNDKSEMLMNFTGIYTITMIVCLIITALFTRLLTHPINKLADTSKRIADGDYKERILHIGNDEIGILSDNFNKMAQAIEHKIDDLSLSIKQKEEFIASFAHELKTPLTSVIGYADMLYQKDLSREMVKDSAFYIYSEGMRLEALSLKLLDLTLLDKQEFILEEASTVELADNAMRMIMIKQNEFGIKIHSQVEEALVKAECDLIFTLLLNLLDNAVKSGGDEIHFIGKNTIDNYEFIITDNGRGIPENELHRIKEAFYMVDKSRSRKQHGVGLGLALAEKIARIHHSTLIFESNTGIGTTVMFKMEKVKEDGDIIV